MSEINLILTNDYDEFETYSESVFKNVAIDIIIKKCKIPEDEAENKFNKLYNNIFIFDKECLTPGKYYSIRYAVMNRINKM